MKPNGLLDDRFQALEKKTEMLGNLCEQVLQSNVAQRSFMERMERLEGHLEQVRRENVGLVKVGKNLEVLKGLTDQMTRASQQGAGNEEKVLWKVAMDIKELTKRMDEQKRLVEQNIVLSSLPGQPSRDLPMSRSPSKTERNRRHSFTATNT